MCAPSSTINAQPPIDAASANDAGAQAAPAAPRSKFDWGVVALVFAFMVVIFVAGLDIRDALYPPKTVPDVPFSTIKVGPLNYQVFWVGNSINCNGVDAVGCTDANRMMMIVDNEPSIPLDGERMIVFHELSHAILGAYYPPDATFNQEDIADMTLTYLDVLRDNPQVRDFLFATTNNAR